MRKRGYVVFFGAAAALAVSHVLLTVRIFRLEAEIGESVRRLDEYGARLDSRIAGAEEKMEAGIRELSGTLSMNSLMVQERLSSLDGKAQARLAQTEGMKKTYDALLDEQKKKTVDTTSRDTAVAAIRTEAEKHYAEKKYALAFSEFSKVLSYQGDDMQSRLKKMKSLYYKNRADSSRYSEILEDIRILSLGGFLDEEAAEIGRVISAEREGIHE